MSSQILHVHVEEARLRTQFLMQDWVRMRLRGVVVRNVPVKDVREDKGGGAIAHDDGVDQLRNGRDSHLKETNGAG